MRNTGILLERIRKACGFKNQPDFVLDIVDVRQYQRYVSGESSPPIDIFVDIIRNTNLSPNEVIDILYEESVLERNVIAELYNAIISNDVLKVKELKNRIDRETIMENKNLLLYEYSLLIEAHKKKEINDVHYVSSIKDLIKYPEILDKELLSLIELIALGELLYFPPNNDHQKIFDKIYHALDEQSNLLDFTERNDKLLNLIFRLSNYLGMIGEYDKSIGMCKRGIDISLKYKEFYLLDYFYYYQALGFHNLGKLEERDLSIIDCYLVLLNKKNEKETDKFRKLFKEDFGIDNVEALLIERFNNFSSTKL